MVRRILGVGLHDERQVAVAAGVVDQVVVDEAGHRDELVRTQVAEPEAGVEQRRPESDDDRRAGRSRNGTEDARVERREAPGAPLVGAAVHHDLDLGADDLHQVDEGGAIGDADVERGSHSAGARGGDHACLAVDAERHDVGSAQRLCCRRRVRGTATVRAVVGVAATGGKDAGTCERGASEERSPARAAVAGVGGHSKPSVPLSRESDSARAPRSAANWSFCSCVTSL